MYETRCEKGCPKSIFGQMGNLLVIYLDFANPTEGKA